MTDTSRHVDVVLPEHLSIADVQDRIEMQIRINASEAGEFVQRMSFTHGSRHSAVHRVWTGTYVVGPPAPYPVCLEHNRGTDIATPPATTVGRGATKPALHPRKGAVAATGEDA